MEFANGSGKVDPAANDPDKNNATELEAAYRELALRLAIWPGDPRSNNPQIYIGKLPPELPAEFPLPSATRLLGSLVRSAQHIDLYLDTSLTPEKVIEFYTLRLTGAGWQKVDPSMFPGNFGGFIGGNRPMQHIEFCQGDHGPSLTLQTNPNSSGDVRINVNLDTANSPCDPARQKRMRERPMMVNLIPNLMPPPGNIQNFDGGGSGGSQNSWFSSATLDAGLELAALAIHYNAQLEKAGWHLSGQGVNGPIAWSQWTLQDRDGEDWQGRFLIYRNFINPRNYFLQANVTRNQPGPSNQVQNSTQLRF